MAHAPYPRWISLDDLERTGYLQEANRQFFHPLGLSLDIVQGEIDTSSRYYGVRDFRDWRDGVAYATAQLGLSASPELALVSCMGDIVTRQRANNIRQEWSRRAAARLASLGFVTQPLGDTAQNADEIIVDKEYLIALERVRHAAGALVDDVPTATHEPVLRLRDALRAPALQAQPLAERRNT